MSDSKSMMSIEEFQKKMEIMFPNYELEEGEELIHEWPDSEFAKKRKEELMEEIDSIVLIEEICEKVRLENLKVELKEKTKFLEKEKHELEEKEREIDYLTKRFMGISR